LSGGEEEEDSLLRLLRAITRLRNRNADNVDKRNLFLCYKKKKKKLPVCVSTHARSENGNGSGGNGLI